VDACLAAHDARAPVAVDQQPLGNAEPTISVRIETSRNSTYTAQISQTPATRRTFVKVARRFQSIFAAEAAEDDDDVVVF
jgi:hypothetical protein